MKHEVFTSLLSNLVSTIHIILVFPMEVLSAGASFVGLVVKNEKENTKSPENTTAWPR